LYCAPFMIPGENVGNNSS